MSTESEEVLEVKLVQQLTNTLGYTFVAIPDEAALLTNLKKQLETHNKISLSAIEFKQVLHELDRGGACLGKDIT